MKVKNVITKNEFISCITTIEAYDTYLDSCAEIGFEVKNHSMQDALDLLSHIFGGTDAISQWVFRKKVSVEYEIDGRKHVINNTAELYEMLVKEYGNSAVMPLTFAEFDRYISNMKSEDKYKNKCYSLGIRFDDSISCNDSVEMLLSGIMGEREKDAVGYTTLTWWIYEKGFGQRDDINTYGLNGNIVPMETPLQLYEHLMSIKTTA